MAELLSENFQQLIENASDLVMISQDNIIIYANPLAHLALGYAPGELKGKAALELAHPQARRDVGERVARATGGARNPSLLVQLLKKDGSALSIDGSSFPMSINGRPAVVMMGRDLTEHKEVVEQRRRLEVVLESAPVGIISLDETLRVTHWNRAAASTWLWPSHTPGAQPPMLPENRKLMNDLCRQAGERNQVVNVTQKLVRGADGRESEVRASVAPLSDPEFGLRGFVVVIDDLSERKQLEKQAAGLRDSLRRAGPLSAMGELIAGVAHEVRNPLFGMSAALDVIESRGGPPDKFLQILRGELERLNRLMRDLLDYGKPPAAAMSREPLEPVLRAAMHSCSAIALEAGVSIAASFAPDLEPLLLDAGRLAQVFQNLLQNAIQHSKRGEEVRLEARPMGASIEVRVLNDGSGIRPEDMPRLFEPFFTRRRGGTGLGLAIVQRIVEQHSGTVLVKNRPDGGVEVCVALPCAT